MGLALFVRSDIEPPLVGETITDMGFLIMGLGSLAVGGVLAFAGLSESADCVNECHGYALLLILTLLLVGLGVLGVVGGLTSFVRDRNRRRLAEYEYERRELEARLPLD